MKYFPANKCIRYLVKFFYALGFIVLVTYITHQINSLLPQHVIIVSESKSIPTPIPSPTTSIEDRFNILGQKICNGVWVGWHPDVVHKIEISDDRTEADVTCMNPDNHNITGTYQIGI